MDRGKVTLAALLLIGSVALAAPPAAAQVYPSCPPGYFFAPAYGLCFPAGYAYDPTYYYNPGYYPYYPYYPYISGFVSAPASPLPIQRGPPTTRFTTGQIGPFTTGTVPSTTSPAPTTSAPTSMRRR
jgi:hypothetical protein